MVWNSPPSARAPPALIVVGLAAEKLFVPNPARVPPFTVVAPVYVLEPARFTRFRVPAPVFVRPPVPARAAYSCPDWTAKVPLVVSVPFWTKPLTSVTPPFWVWLVLPRSSVATPLTIVEPDEAPSVPEPESCSVPLCTFVPPLYVFAPVRTSVPWPCIDT